MLGSFDVALLLRHLKRLQWLMNSTPEQSINSFDRDCGDLRREIDGQRGVGSAANTW
jgi:hypothetical protein